MQNWEELKAAVEKNNNVLTVTMETLRNIHGAGRLGQWVIADINKNLAGIGLGHVPVDLPNYASELVRIYKNGTPMGELIATVLSPGEQNDSKLSSQFASGGVDYAVIVEKIRELVAQ
jgi:hypothetical protein